MLTEKLKNNNSVKNHTNFLLVLIIVAIALFILLCPRKTIVKQNFNNILTQQEEENNMLQQYFELNENKLHQNNLISTNETEKIDFIQNLNLEYDTRGDMNDLINHNQMPNAGTTMFVYP